MAEQNSGNTGSFPAILNGFLLLFTLVGGILLVSPKLTSQRPLPPSIKQAYPIGAQTLPARLWEDPFHPSDSPSVRTFDDLTNEIARSATSNVLFVPVMISGGAYSEDQESRIRSRFAIVSALGQKGYVPADAEHLGEVIIDWPATSDLERWKTNVKAELIIALNKPASGSLSTNDLVFSGVSINRAPDNNITLRGVVIRQPVGTDRLSNAVTGSIKLSVRYEWYRPRVFFPRSNDKTVPEAVLVLWLDDDSFEDDPLLRLPLFLKPLMESGGLPNPSSNIMVRLIGPSRSSTLRAMLPNEFSDEGKDVRSNTNLWTQAAKTLHHVALYSATASAMDEVLVTNADATCARKTVSQKLVANGFGEAHFFNSTDAQMAAEIFDELQLRGVDMNDLKNHLVLLSEWDTFYGRALSLTYGATLAKRQGNAGSRYQFVTNYLNGTGFPKNFHTLVYLRGLDGRTVGGHSETDADKAGKSGHDHSKPGTFEDLLHWTPDANLAEGPGQFDYLSRTGEWIDTLQQELKSSDTGTIKAVGICGSDVYDVLLILQALRPRFPNVLFFTTDLDARFWHPSQREWSRNLIVASSYGLRLHPDFQKDIAPFRDSLQTAQFTAALAALGDANLASLTNVQPRRFEIGNRTTVDLSVSDSLLHSDGVTANAKTGPWLHPLTLSQDYAMHSEGGWKRGRGLSLMMLVLSLAMAAYFYWNPFRSRPYNYCGFLSKHLPFSDEDVGGPEGADFFIRHITAAKDKDTFCNWLYTACIEKAEEKSLFLLPELPKSDQPSTSGMTEAAEREAEGQIQSEKIKRTDVFVSVLNSLLHHDPELRVDEKSVLRSSLIDQCLVKEAGLWKMPVSWRRLLKRLVQRFRARQILDGFLDRLTLDSVPGNSQILGVASDARLAARKLFWMNLSYAAFIIFMVIAISILALCMQNAIWSDTFIRPDGDPFSLVSGVSAWPNIVLRWVSGISAAGFIFVLIQQLRSMFYSLSRRYRIPVEVVVASSKPRCVCASKLWNELHKSGNILGRLGRAGIPCGIYFAFGMLLLVLLGFPFEPLRGDAIIWWAGPIKIAHHPIHPFVIFFLLLSFLTIDASLRCRRFINELSAAPTEYPKTTRDYFKSLRGDVSEEYLDEWIDTQLIADMTERVQGLLWFPGIVLLLMLASRNQYTDHWPWSAGLTIIITLNFILASASMIILQCAARQAKRRAEENLYAKVKRAQAAIAPTPQANNAAQAEKLLEEIRDLKRGAFTGFWENPVIGAVFLAPGGTAIIQIIIWATNQ